MLPWKSRDRKQGKGRKVKYFNKYEMFHPEHVWKNNSSFFQKKKTTNNQTNMILDNSFLASCNRENKNVQSVVLHYCIIRQEN